LTGVTTTRSLDVMNAASDLLSLEEKRRLGAKSNLAGALLVLHAWVLILGSMAIFAWWPNPFTFLLGAMVIGGRQLGLAILMHDAAHGLLFADRRLNDWVGSWFCAYPVFTSLTLYRPYHLQHHRFTQQAGDPDLALSAPFPISRTSLRRKIVRDLTGRTAYLRRGDQIRRALGPADAPLAVRLGRLWQREKGSLLVNAAMLIACGERAIGGSTLCCGCCHSPPGTSSSAASGTLPSMQSFPTTTIRCATPAPPTPIRWSGS
jgi:hypothetical protein